MFKTLTTIIRTASKEIGKNRIGKIPDWEYKVLTNEHFKGIASSDYLKKLTSNLIKNKDNEKSSELAEYIVGYIRKFHLQNSTGYRAVLKMVKKVFNEIDLSDLL